MRFLIIFSILILTIFSVTAQEKYRFTNKIDLDATPVISQGNTGTCWSFSTSSFLESEIIRLTGKQIDLSEMYTVRNTYPKKAENYVMRQGKAQFGEGGLAHDVLNIIDTHGLVPLSAYSGLNTNSTSHDHTELEAVLAAMLKAYVKDPEEKLSKKWKPAFNAVLDVYLGEIVSNFKYEGKNYTPATFLKMTKINPSDYVSITSFTQANFYSSFILNVPDNWSYGSFYNVPLDELITSIDNALKNGFTVELDCDVSGSSFSSEKGLAVVPASSDNDENALQGIYPEKEITQEYRQDEFENFTTTDDHLMHITGLLKDQNGTKYYKVKNSWGANPDYNANNGYVYFSEAYMRLNTISITIHKDAVSKKIAKKLKF